MMEIIESSIQTLSILFVKVHRAGSNHGPLYQLLNELDISVYFCHQVRSIWSYDLFSSRGGNKALQYFISVACKDFDSNVIPTNVHNKYFVHIIIIGNIVTYHAACINWNTNMQRQVINYKSVCISKLNEYTSYCRFSPLHVCFYSCRKRIAESSNMYNLSALVFNYTNHYRHIC